MANIPLRDIPELPRADISLPMPEGRVPDMPRLKEISGRLENPFNFRQHTRSLMQEGVDERVVASMGAANMQVANSMVKFGDAMGKLGASLQKSKAIADISRVDNDATQTWLAFNEKANQEKWQPDERYRQWSGEDGWGPALYKRIAKDNVYGLSGYSQSEALPRLTNFIGRKSSDLSDGAFRYQIKQDEIAIRTRIENSLAAGDKLGALEGNTDLTRANLQTKEEEEKGNRDINEKMTEHAMQVQMNIDPRPVLEEMREAKLYGKSDVYPEVKDPSAIAKYEDAAQRATNAMYTDVGNDITNRILEGEVTNMEQVRSLANGRLEARHLAVYAQQLVGDPVHDPQVVEELRTRIKNYDGVSDKRLEQYDAIHEQIATSVPKHLQGVLNDELYKQQVQTREGKLKESHDKFLGKLFTEVDELGKDGYFGPTGRDPKKESQIVDWAVHIDNYERVTDAKNHLENWMRENPNASTKEAIDELRNMVGQAGADKADREIRARKQEVESMRDISNLPGVPGAGMPAGAGAQTSNGLPEDLVTTVKGLEGFTRESMWDYKQYSVGYGTRGKAGEQLTEKEADTRLRQELGQHAQNIDRAAVARGIPLTEGQRKALISFDFNTGRGALLIQTSSSVADIRRRMALYTKATQKDGTKVELSGLKNRRREELAMFDS